MRRIFFSLLLFAVFPSFAFAQWAPCTAPVSSIIFVPTKVKQTRWVAIEEEAIVNVEYAPKVQAVCGVSWAPVSACVSAREVFDIECAAKMGREFLECTQGATNRRQRFRCALQVVINNADCIFSQASATPARRVWFPRIQARREARALAASYR